MWTLLAAGYTAGLIGTMVALRRERLVETGRVVETVCSLLWPLYWGILGLCIYRDRRRSGI